MDDGPRGSAPPDPGHLRGRGDDLGQVSGQVLVRFGVDADRGQVGGPGHRTGPVAGAVRDAAEHVGRPARLARRAGQNRRGRHSQPGQCHPGAQPSRGEFGPAPRPGRTHRPLLGGEQAPAGLGQLAEGLRRYGG